MWQKCLTFCQHINALVNNNAYLSFTHVPPPNIDIVVNTEIYKWRICNLKQRMRLIHHRPTETRSEGVPIWLFVVIVQISIFFYE